MLQYKIPQDVGVEDKIVGPLSLRQLIIVAVGVGISYVIYAISAKMYELNTLEYIVIALPALIAAAAAFIRINNVSFTKFVLLFLEFGIKPKKRLWDHRGIAHLVAPDLKEKKTGAAVVVAEGKKRKDVDLDELSRILDSGGFENVKVEKHEDIDKVKDEDLMTEAYFGHKKSESPTENMYWRTKESHKKRLEMLAKLPATKKQEEKPKEAVKIEQKAAPQEAKSTSAPIKTIPAKHPQAQLKPEVDKTAQKIQPPIIPKPTDRQVQPLQVAHTKPIEAESKPAQTPPVKPQMVNPIQPATVKPQTIKPEATKPLIQKSAIPDIKKTIAQPQKNLTEIVPSNQQTVSPAQGTSKKKRRRNKKPKTLTPVRPETQINNTQKNKPVALIPKEKTEVRKTPGFSGEKPDMRQEQQANKTKNGQIPIKQEQPDRKEKPEKADQTGGEIHLEELKKGEITWGF